MDYQRFLEQLPGLYENWEKDSVRPKSDRFQRVLLQIQGMTTPNVMQLLNSAVTCMEQDEIYCEVGTFRGSTLIGAMLDHPDRMAYAVDNFSLFDTDGTNIDKLNENLANFGLEDRVFFCNQDFESFLLELGEIGTEDKIGVYLYDGAHDYRSQLMGLLLIKPFLADRALIIVDDANWPTVQQANIDFVATNPECQFVLDLFTPGDGHHTFWNGIQVLSWDSSKTSNYSANDLLERRQLSVIEDLFNLQQIEVSKTAAHNRALGLNLHLQKAETYSRLGVSLAKQSKLDEAIANFQQAISVESNFAEAHYNLGLAFTEQGKLDKAIASYQQSITIKPDYFDANLNLGGILIKVNQPAQAITYLTSAIEIDANCAEAYLNLGSAFSQLDNFGESILNYRKAIVLRSDYAEAYSDLGGIFTRNGDLEQAITNLQKAIEINPNCDGAYCNLGDALFKLNNLTEALSHFQQAILINPNSAEAHADIGAVLIRQNKIEEAIPYLQKAIILKSDLIEAYLNFGVALSRQKRYDEEIACYQELIVRDLADMRAYYGLAKALEAQGKTEEAIAYYQETLNIEPEHSIAYRSQRLILPVIYDNQTEIYTWRKRLTLGLNEYIEKLLTQLPFEPQWALNGIGSNTNFYLAYQGHNDLGLQQIYGQMLQQVMAVNYPQWANLSSSRKKKTDNQKIRIGYISCYFRNHTIGKLFLGWLRYHDHHSFETFVYYVGETPDRITEEFQKESDHFQHIPGDVPAVCKQICADNLDVLVFTDIGMDPQTMQIAALKLAPVQCVSWGHPVTTGLPTIDYFLSSDLMEPKEYADTHYSEKLIRLPKLSISYPKPNLPAFSKTRKDFQLCDTDIVYIACQSLFKYLPQYDHIFASIAQRIPAAKFVFVSQPSDYLNKRFQKRLQHTFTEIGLDSQKYCVLVPHLNQNDFFNLNYVSDIYLDSLAWSGGNTTLEAIACSLPVVTYPGEFMRGRHTYAMLKLLQVTDTIAQSESEYIEIAVKLGLDSIWRQQIVSKMQQNLDYLYDDRTCIQELEAFYKSVVLGNP